MHTHPSWSTHDTMYARVYTCAHCDRKGHLTKFCYDRINVSNFASKHVWVRKDANPRGPKKVWVSKFIPISFDVGVALTRLESIGALMVDAFQTKWS